VCSKEIGLPRIPPPVQVERGHPPGYSGHVPGRDDSYAETYGARTARFNTPRDNNDSNHMAASNPLQPFSTSSSVYGDEVGGDLSLPEPELPSVPPLSLAEGRTGVELEALALRNPGVHTGTLPRAKPPRSQRFQTKNGFNEKQIDFVRRLDLAAQHGTDALAEHNDHVIVLIPVACKIVGQPEERVRMTALSLPGSRLARDDVYNQGSLTGVAIPLDTWEKALNCTSS